MLTLKVHSFISRNFVCCASFCSFNCPRRLSSFLEVLVITTGSVFLFVFIAIRFFCKVTVFKQLRKLFNKNHTTSPIQIPHPKAKGMKMGRKVGSVKSKERKKEEYSSDIKHLTKGQSIRNTSENKLTYYIYW